VKNFLPDVFKNVNASYTKEKLFVKIHDAYTVNTNGQPIVPEEPTYGAVYFIRNPLDVAASLANHNNSTIDEAITLMNTPEGTLAKQKISAGALNINNQLPQLMLGWSGHVASWTHHLPFPVLVLRYEDMLKDTLPTFTKAVAFMGIQKSQEAIMAAIEKCRFDKLKEQELDKGFREKHRNSPSFFRSGQSGQWKTELTAAQIKRIVNNHKKLMLQYGYEIPDVDLLPNTTHA